MTGKLKKFQGICYAILSIMTSIALKNKKYYTIGPFYRGVYDGLTDGLWPVVTNYYINPFDKERSTELCVGKKVSILDVKHNSTM